MAKIEFKAKVKVVYMMEGEVAYNYVKVPVFTRNHCDMSAFRQHPKYGGWANSDLFPGIINRVRREKFKNNILNFSEIPEGVVVDDSGFLAKVTIEV